MGYEIEVRGLVVLSYFHCEKNYTQTNKEKTMITIILLLKDKKGKIKHEDDIEYDAPSIFEAKQLLYEDYKKHELSSTHFIEGWAGINETTYVVVLQKKVKKA